MSANINHSNDELENVASNVLRDIEDADDFKVIKKLIKRAARHYHEAMTLRDHRLAEQAGKDTAAILEAAKELGRVDALQELAKFGTDQISVYEEGEGFRWHHSHYMRTIGEGYTVESLLEHLDAHRKVVV